MAKPVFRELDTDIVDRMKKFGIERSYPEGGQIFAEGEQADFLPAVLSGRVKMVRSPEPGKEIIIGTFGPGELFAIPPALDGKAFPSTAVAMEPTTVLILPREHFLSLLKESIEFSATVMQRMCGILRDRADTIQVLSTPSAEQRVAQVLLALAQKDAAEFPLRIALRRQDIAEMAGLTLESTIRSIRKLADRELLKIVRGKVVVEETSGLQRLVAS